jgi:hypothetical protein
VDACIDTLFSVTGASAGQVFNQAKMVTIANALQSGAPGHTKCGRASPAFWRIRYSTRAFPPISAHPTGSIFRRSRAAGGGRGEVGDRREQALDSLICMQDRHSRSCAGARVSPSPGGDGVNDIHSRRQIRRSDRIPAKSIPVARSNTRRIRFSSVAVVCSLTELEQAPNVCSSKEISA